MFLRVPPLLFPLLCRRSQARVHDVRLSQTRSCELSHMASEIIDFDFVFLFWLPSSESSPLRMGGVRLLAGPDQHRRSRDRGG